MAVPSELELYGKSGSYNVKVAEDVFLEESTDKDIPAVSSLLHINNPPNSAAHSTMSSPQKDTLLSVDLEDCTDNEHTRTNESQGVRFSDQDSIGSADDINSSSKRLEVDDGKDEVDFFDKISQYSLFMVKDARYYFQHPYARLFVAYLIVFCNFLIYAEDPVAHSVKECTIPAIGNAFAFVFTKYPPNYWSAVKVLLWMIAIACGLVFGKLVVHRLFLKRLCRLEMFQEDQGSFMVMFLTTILFLFVFSWVYNLLLMTEAGMYELYGLTGPMGVSNSWFMKAAACGTWCGDFFTAWMVTDIMFQEKLYPHWAMPVRRWWKRGYNRIILFWCVTVVMSVLVVVVITTDIIAWDKLNRGFLPTNELARAMLASFILLMDLTILMQDWDFPHFVNSLDIKLPGLNVGSIHIEIPKCLKKLEKWTIHVEGKWFQYGVIFIVMILDLNMWKNQVFYQPYDYGQYVDPDHRVYTVTSTDQLAMFNKSMLTYDWRNNNTNPLTNQSYAADDAFMYSKFVDFHVGIQITAFIPSLAGGITFITLIFMYGRVKPTKSDPYAGRLKKREKTKGLTIMALVRMKLVGNRFKKRTGSVGDHKTADSAAGSGKSIKSLKDTGEVKENKSVTFEADIHPDHTQTSSSVDLNRNREDVSGRDEVDSSLKTRGSLV